MHLRSMKLGRTARWLRTVVTALLVVTVSSITGVGIGRLALRAVQAADKPKAARLRPDRTMRNAGSPTGQTPALSAQFDARIIFGPDEGTTLSGVLTLDRRAGDQLLGSLVDAKFGTIPVTAVVDRSKSEFHLEFDLGSGRVLTAQGVFQLTDPAHGVVPVQAVGYLMGPDQADLGDWDANGLGLHCDGCVQTLNSCLVCP